MITTLLAASILASVPAAVEKTLSTPRVCFGLEEPDAACLAAMQDPPLELITRAEFEVWTARTVRNEQIRDSTISCIVEAAARAGGDSFSTALAGKYCPTCAEQNPLGFSQEARYGLKLAQLGAEVGLCSLAAKHQYREGAESDHRHGKWIGRGINGAVIVMNVISAIRGKPLIRWSGSPSPETLK